MEESIKEEIKSLAFKEVDSHIIQCSNKSSAYPTSFVDLERSDFCPEVFRRIRQQYNIPETDYTLAVCGVDVVKDTALDGKPGRVIQLNNDDRFVIRTIRKSQFKVIVNKLAKYYLHLKTNPSSVLTKVYGLHMVRPVGGVRVHFAVLSNIIPLDKSMYRVYDLKGSLEGRSGTKTRVDETVIHKDIDFDLSFYLDPLVRERLLEQIKCDCNFLECEGLMDYSILLGVAMPKQYQVSVDNKSCSSDESLKNKTTSNSFEKTKRFADPTFSPTSFGSNSSSSGCISSPSLGDIDEDYSGIQGETNYREGYKFGSGMPALAVRMGDIGTRSGSSRHLLKEMGANDVQLYFGIVDMFQDYTVVKRIEHAYKSIRYDSKMIPAVNPRAYSSRLQDYVKKIFVAHES